MINKNITIVESRENIAFERAFYNYMCSKSLKTILHESPYYNNLELSYQLIYNDKPVENKGFTTISFKENKETFLQDYIFNFKFNYFDLGFVVAIRDFVIKFKESYQNELFFNFNSCLLSFYSESELSFFEKLDSKISAENCKYYIINKR